MWKDFLSLIYPKLCLGCNNILLANQNSICSSCLIELSTVSVANKSLNFFSINEYFSITYLYSYNNPLVKELIYALKYKGQYRLGKLLGVELAKVLVNKGMSTKIDAIVPVPIHKSKRRKRGYNQSFYIAKGVAEVLKVPLREIVIKTTRGNTQTNKKRYDRWLNVNDSFDLVESSIDKNDHILIVDDVITTGATMESCAQAIFKMGIKKISVACLASA